MLPCRLHCISAACCCVHHMAHVARCASPLESCCREWDPHKTVLLQALVSMAESSREGAQPSQLSAGTAGLRML